MRRMATKKNATVGIDVDLGPDLKAAAVRAARASGVNLNEFICNALESTVRREREYQRDDSYVRHGGKHLMGKHTGYEVTPDGKYYPAPTWVERFDNLFAERQAIHLLINQVYATAQERLVAVEKQIQKAKFDLIDDLGLDPEKKWAYYYAHYMAEEKPAQEDAP